MGRLTPPDYKFRAYLLHLLDGREMSPKEIWGAMEEDAPWKKISYRRLLQILNNLAFHSHLRKMRVKEKREADRCLHVYTVTDRGRKRREYYEIKIKEYNL